jgi:2,3-bisphosphoglycerate-independent phosphoglycerate mutase
VILDGWGLSPISTGNAIFNTPTPNFNKLLTLYPHYSLHASGEEAGLSWGEMGNSEVGHLNLGTGRVTMQDLPRINKTIEDKTFFKNQALLDAIENTKKNNSNLHLIGLFSSGGVHSHLDHLLALLDLAKQENVKNVYIHLISDGRDTPEKAILKDLPKLLGKIKENGIGQISTISGRYYAMDRDKHLERTEKAFNVLINSSSPAQNTINEAINNSYARNKTDEFIEPIAITNTAKIKSNDSVIFYNFRSDRARQLADKIISIKDIFFTSFTSYGHESTPKIKVAFFADKINGQLAQIISLAKLTQFHIAETEKYAHVTYFFNGGMEDEFPGEERILVQSPGVATYDLAPEMSADEVSNKFIEFFESKIPIFTVLNYANPDMVGHTGVMLSTQKAIAKVDECLGKILQKIIDTNADFLITADHGNAEQMINIETGEIDKEHTTNPVPLIIGFKEKMIKNPVEISSDGLIAFSSAQPTGILSDVTATIINRLKLNKPDVITGQSLEG